MDMYRLPALLPYVRREWATSDPEERAKLENLAWDERPPLAGTDLYASQLGKDEVVDLDNWHGRHGDYLDAEVNLDDTDKGRLPWTFRPDNARNRLLDLDPRQYLIRVEAAAWPCDLSGLAPAQLDDFVQRRDSGEEAALDYLQGFVARWNAQRDRRPLFATTFLEVEEIVTDAAPDWAERLRDVLGLGHYSPGPGSGPIEIIAMRYTVQEVLDSLPGNGHPAIPTVLDGGLNSYFHPSPLPGPDAAPPYYGRTLNLREVDQESDYALGVELLHPSLVYRPEHLYRVGRIARPWTMNLERARRFHLPWLRLYTDRPDFACSTP